MKKTKTVTVTDIPLTVLRQVQRAARANGVEPTMAGQIRWALMMFARGEADKYGTSWPAPQKPKA